MKRTMHHPRGEAIVMGVVWSSAVFVVFSPSTWIGMMVRSFLPQWTVVFAVAGVWLARRRDPLPAWSLIGGALLMASQLSGSSARVHAPIDLRVAQFNVLQTNRSHADVIASIHASDADLVSVQEVDAAWAVALCKGLADRYPVRIIEPRSNCYGIALFSRVPLKDAHVLMLAASPAIEATVGTARGDVRIFAVHASSPGSPGHFRARNRQYELLAEHIVRMREMPTVVIGDLNAAPWDRDLLHFRACTGLRSNASLGAPTFPAVAHLALIPIDHVLTSARARVVHERTVHVPGSDHRGLVADIAVGG